MSIRTEARNASLSDLRDLLVEQHARKIDIVAPASKIRLVEGDVVVKGTDPILDEDGVTEGDGIYRPTAVFDEGLADKMRIPLAYVRRMRAERPDLLDANVNGWLHGRKAKVLYGAGTAEPKVLREAIPGDSRSFLVRAFRGDDQETGIARALLSDCYSVMDNLDVLTAALDGVRQAGVNVQIEGCDLTDRRMYVRIIAPEVKVLAESLLKGYRSPFREGGVERSHLGLTVEQGRALAAAEGQGFGDGAEPVVFSGFVISNSETGDGAFTITPRLVIQVCKNGLTITRDVLRNVHLGGQMEEGVIRWSADTQQKAIALVTARARDAVSTFLDVDYVTRAVRGLEVAADVRVKAPADDIKIVAKRLGFDQATMDGVLEHFILGGVTTAGGLMNAVTSYAQTVPDADKAHRLEALAVAALETAAAL